MATHAALRDDDAIEREIQVKGKTAARVTPQDLEAVVSHAFYFTAEDGVVGAHQRRRSSISVEHSSEPHALALLTFCVLVLRNGFIVTGESACASPENFDAEIGRKIARQNAIAKIWPLEGYLLKQRLYEHNRPAEVQS
ncbi:Gp49 family protein [Burkholderia pseudomultivorans]|nr:Gp49 family protein [Burkholderia pseudomultivorans]